MSRRSDGGKNLNYLALGMSHRAGAKPSGKGRKKNNFKYGGTEIKRERESERVGRRVNFKPISLVKRILPSDLKTSVAPQTQGILYLQISYFHPFAPTWALPFSRLNVRETSITDTIKWV